MRSYRPPQECRFHIFYKAMVPHENLESLGYPERYSRFRDTIWDNRERSILMRNASNISRRVPHGTIEWNKVREMLHRYGLVSYCMGCRPNTLKDPLEEFDPTAWCRCNPYTRFVEPWRCIPCVLAEEARMIASEQKRTRAYTDTTGWCYVSTSLDAWRRPQNARRNALT